MGEIDTELRDRDENKPDGRLPSLITGASRYRAPLNNSVSLSSSSGSSCLGGDSSHSSASSKSNSPDHVVPTETSSQHHLHHRLSTSSGSSSPQTDGSITFRRYVGPGDVSRSSSSNGRSVTDEAVSPRQYPPPARRQPAGGGGAAKEGRKFGSTQRKESGRRSNQQQQQRIPKKRARKQAMLAGAEGDAVDGRKEENENDSESDYVIRCICGFKDILGEQIQCEKCEVWQHFGCMGIEQSAVPDCYLCEVCDPGVERPLQPEEARELHEALLIADRAHSAEERIRRKAKRITQRKPSDVSSSPPVVPPRQTDLISSDKKKTDTTAGSSGGGSVTVTRSPGENGVGGNRPSAPKDDLCELSRDDRKILQYEQMFKRMEERRDKKGRRKRNPEGSSNGSPSREFGGRGDREDESHEDSTNPPPSPPIHVAAVTVITQATVVVVEQQPQPPPVLAPTVFVPPKETIFMVPQKEIPPTRTRKVRRSKEEKLKARKDSSASESDATEKVDKKKARYSMRLRNSASAKVVAVPPQEDSRIELNCVKKTRKKEETDGCGADDEMNTSPVMQPVKRRLRTASFVDSYYSAMADVQAESETQKASRRNRAYSASQEWEKVKVEQERSRLYHLYGLKKAVCARFNEEPIDKLLESATRQLEASRTAFKFTQPDVFAGHPRPAPGPSRIAKRISSPDSLVATAMKRSRTVRAMIEESARKNADYERAQQAGQVRLAVAHPPLKIQDATPTRPPITAAEIISAATALRSDVFGKNAMSVVKDSGKAIVESEVASSATAGLAEFIGAGSQTNLLVNAPMENLPTDPAPLKEVKADEPAPVTTPKKLSLAEYKQRKLSSQLSSDSLTSGSVFSSPPITPIKDITSPPSIPGKSAVDDTSDAVPILPTPVSAAITPPRPTAPSPATIITPSRMTSVIHRIGTVNSNLIPRNPADGAPQRPSSGQHIPPSRPSSAAAPSVEKPSTRRLLTTSSSSTPDHHSHHHNHHRHSSSLSALTFRPSSARTHVVEDLKT